MPISDQALTRKLIPRIFSPTLTVVELLYIFAEQSEPELYYAVVGLDTFGYDVLALDDFREASDQWGIALLSLPLSAVPNLLSLGEPIFQSKVSLLRAEREMHRRHRRRLVVLNDNGDIAGILVATMLGTVKGTSPLNLISLSDSLVLGSAKETTTPPHLNTRFKEIKPDEPLNVGQQVSLVIWIGAATATSVSQSSRPFNFDFSDGAELINFTVSVDGDPDVWMIRAVESSMVIAPPGKTTQEAEFSIIAQQAGRDKLHISVEREDRVVVHHI